MTTLKPIGKTGNQFEMEVEKYERVNGATCLIVIDVTRIGNKLAFKEVLAGKKTPTDEQIGDVMESEIRNKIKKCPKDSNVKVQFLYHAGAKPLPVRKGKNRQWKLQDSIRHTLKKFQKTKEPRLKKIFLCGCYSHTNDLDLVNECYKIPSVETVTTNVEVIYLIAGRIGAADTGLQTEDRLTLVVWHKNEKGELIAKKPKEKINEDEELDLNTMFVEKKKALPKDRCPTQHKRNGSGSKKVGTYKSRAAAQAAIVSFSGVNPPYAQTHALKDAEDDRVSFSCPNSSCQTKTLGAVKLTDYKWSIRTSFFRLLISIFGVKRWVLVASYDWESRITCS